jgi:hypothetical protein
MLSRDKIEWFLIIVGIIGLILALNAWNLYHYFNPNADLDYDYLQRLEFREYIPGWLEEYQIAVNNSITSVPLHSGQVMVIELNDPWQNGNASISMIVSSANSPDGFLAKNAEDVRTIVVIESFFVKVITYTGGMSVWSNAPEGSWDLFNEFKNNDYTLRGYRWDNKVTIIDRATKSVVGQRSFQGRVDFPDSLDGALSQYFTLGTRLTIPFDSNQGRHVLAGYSPSDEEITEYITSLWNRPS